MGITTYLPENLLELKLSIVHVGVIIVILILVVGFFGVTSFRKLDTRKRPE